MPIDHAGDEDENGAAGGENAVAAKPAGTAAGTNSQDAASGGTPPAASASGAGAGMRIEVDLVTFQTVRRIAVVIATRCAAALRQRRGGPGTVLIVPPAAAAAIGPARILLKELDALADALAPAGIADEDEAVEGLGGALAGGAAAIGANLAGLPAAFTAIATAIKLLPVEEEHDGRSVGIDERTLAAVIAGRMPDCGVMPILVGGDLPADRPELDVVGRITKAATELRATAGDDAADLAVRIEQTLAPLRDPAAPVQLGLELAAAFARFPGVPVLAARSLAAGGATHKRTHLLTALGFVDPMSFSGGAAILFSLGDPVSGRLILSDVLYETSGRMKSDVEPASVLRGNIGGNG